MNLCVSSCAHHLPSQCFNPTPLKSRRFRVSAPSADAPLALFGGKKELKGIEVIVDKLSPTVRLASSTIVIAGAIAAGNGLGYRFGRSRNAALSGAVALGVAGGAASYALNACAPQVAAVSLHNYVVGFDCPMAVKKKDIEGIAKRYGVSKQDEAFNAELCDIYCQFVSSVLPPAGQEFEGDEVEKIINFKNALGIEDQDAAAKHMEIGRKIFRQMLESLGHEEQMERRAFQKLIYVSTLVFGEASSFLLPWKRVFKVTDSQVEVAICYNAQRLYASKLKSLGRDIGAEQLIRLREAQCLYKLSDELAEKLFKEHARKLVEENVTTVLAMHKSRTRTVRGVNQLVEELDKILAFNDLLTLLKNHPNAERFPPGFGPVSLLGGEYDCVRKINELKSLYRVYITESLSGGRMEDNKLAALSQLRNIFGLGKLESEAITLDVTSKVYRRRLAHAITSGDLEIADSKAKFLQNLCDGLHFDPQKAGEIHEEIYRQNLQLCVTNGDLSDKNVSELLTAQFMLCIPQQVVEVAHADICGSLFEKVVRDAIASGVDGYDVETKKTVRKAAHGLRLTRETALSVASKAVRRVFIGYIKCVRAAGNHTEAAQELNKMIAFNALVVTNLVEDIKGELCDTSTEIHVEVEVKQGEEGEEWDSLQTLKKIRHNKELMAQLGNPGQTEITLKDDLPKRDRTDLYRTYLLFCLTGEVQKIPFGFDIPIKKDDSEYALLNQLGTILGLTTMEIVDLHRSLAEQDFRRQAEVILADGLFTQVRVEQLNNLQKQVGLPPKYTQDIIKSLTSTKMAAALETAVTQGRLSIKQIRELKEANFDLKKMISKSLRETLFKKIVEDNFSSGTGEFDEEEVYEKITSELNIDVDEAKGVVRQVAKSRLSKSLIQAIAMLRQRNRGGVVSSLNDLLACDKAVPSRTLSWMVQEELADLYAIYQMSDPCPENLSRLQYLLGIDDTAAADIREMGDTSLPIGTEKIIFVDTDEENKGA